MMTMEVTDVVLFCTQRDWGEKKKRETNARKGIEKNKVETNALFKCDRRSTISRMIHTLLSMTLSGKRNEALKMRFIMNLVLLKHTLETVRQTTDYSLNAVTHDEHHLFTIFRREWVFLFPFDSVTASERLSWLLNSKKKIHESKGWDDDDGSGNCEQRGIDEDRVNLEPSFSIEIFFLYVRKDSSSKKGFKSRNRRKLKVSMMKREL